MPLYDGMHELVLQEGVWLRWAVNSEEMIRCRCRRHPCNLFREGSKDFFDIWDHVESDRFVVGKINGHPKIIMAMSTCDIQFFISRIVPIG